MAGLSEVVFSLNRNPILREHGLERNGVRPEELPEGVLREGGTGGTTRASKVIIAVLDNSRVIIAVLVERVSSASWFELTATAITAATELTAIAVGALWWSLPGVRT